MLDIFSGLRLVVKRRTINIDNAIFRCHWFFTSTLLVSFSLIITARQYVGQPIECHSVDKIPDSLLNSYCWVQSTFTVPQACGLAQSARIASEVPYPCIDNTRGREIKVYAYYQWVGIVLFVQGLMFHLPYYLWKLWENGLIKAITGGLRVAVLNEHERAKKKEIVVEYIHDHLGCHNRYALKYFLCESTCLINLLGQLWATNKFFDGQFLRYGLEVLEYSSSSLASGTANGNHIATTSTTSRHQSTTQDSSSSSMHFNIHLNQQNSTQNTLPLAPSSTSHQPRPGSYGPNYQQQSANWQQVVDPMTYIFPRMTKCSYFDFGSSGDVQKHDALCLLPLNIINEKIYIALWFWFLILALLTILVIVYRLCAIASEAVRCKGLISRCKLSSERDIRLICKHCDVGDWFLFYMVAENLDPLIMREIIASIASKITDHLELKRELKAQLQLEEDSEREKLRLMLEQQQQLYQAQVPVGTGAGANANQPTGIAIAMQPSAPPPPCQCNSNNPSRRNSIVDQVPLVRKIKKRLYNKRLWSIDLGSAEVRQQLFGAATSSSAGTTPPATGNAHSVGYFASAPPANEMPLGATVVSRRPSLTNAPVQSLQRRGSLKRNMSASSSGISSDYSPSSGSFVMEMSTICGSTPCLQQRGSLGPLQTGATPGWPAPPPNARHHHE